MPAGGLVTAAAIGGTALGIGKFIKGIKENKKAKEEMANLKQPLYKIQEEYKQNRDLAANMAEQGMPSAQRDYATTEMQRNFGSGVSATLQGNGDVDNIAKLLDVNNRSLANLAAQDSATHFQNIDRFLSANKDLAGQKTMKWSIDEYQPYERKINELKQRMSAATQNTWGGLSDAVSGIGALGTGMQNTNLINSQIAKNKQGIDNSDPFAPQSIVPTQISVQSKAPNQFKGGSGIGQNNNFAGVNTYGNANAAPIDWSTFDWTQNP